MRRFTSILIFLLLCSTAFGQIKRKDLLGEWQTKNDDSLYYHSDTMILYRNINHFYNTKTCYLIRWTIEKRDFKLSNVFTCSEPGRISAFSDREKLRLAKTDFGQIITLERNKQVFDRFKIIDLQEKEIDRYPHEIGELKLMRFDDLTDCKLYKHVDSLIFRVLKYDAKLIDTTYYDILRNGSVAVSKIRSTNEINPEPLIVLNGHIVYDKEVLKQFRLVETTGIEYLTKEQSASIYGMKAINGVIVLTISEKRFNIIWKNYGR